MSPQRMQLLHGPQRQLQPCCPAVLPMREAVRNCYKRLVWVGRSYPTGWPSIRDKVKAAFFRNAHISSDEEVGSLVSKAEFVERELEALRKLHKCVVQVLVDCSFVLTTCTCTAR